MVSFSLFREGLDILLFKNKKNLILLFSSDLEFYLLSSNSNSFFLSEKHIQNSRPNFLMFLDHGVSFDQNKS